MKRTLTILFFILFSAILSSCAAPFYKGGYMFNKNSKSYFGNDTRKIYINFSDKYYYSKIGFNANNLSTNDLELAEEFKARPKHILFSYNSASGKQVMVFLLNKRQIDLNSFQKAVTENEVFYFKTIEKNNFTYRENIYPFQNNFVKIIEKSPSFLDKNGQKVLDDKTKIFPLISTEKPN